MLNNLNGLQGALIGVAVLVFFVVRQFSTRRIANRWTVLLPIALAFIGLPGLASLSSTGWLLLCLNVSLGIALGFARGASMRVWSDAAGEALMRGTLLTATLWLATIAVRAGLAFAEVHLGLGPQGTSNSETLLPAAATIGAQVVVAYLRARDLRLATA